MAYAAQLTAELTLSRCPLCGISYPRLASQLFKQSKNQAGNMVRWWGVYECATCGGFITAWSVENGGQVQEVFPNLKLVSEEIPVQARNFLTQASESLHAPSGAIMLAGSAVDAMLKDKGYIKGSLKKRIDEAAAKHLITNEMALWAHEIRLEANDERHADLGSLPPDREEAERSVDFALALGEFLFVLPARVTRGIEASASASTSPSATPSPSSSASPSS